MCPILLKQNGTLIRRPRWRARACEMGGAGKARPRGWFAWFGAGCLPEGYLGAPPPCPLFACQRRERSEAFRGRRWAEPYDTGMSGRETRKPVKDSSRLRPAPKRFSLWSLRGFFLTRQKEISQKPPCGGLPSARRAAHLHPSAAWPGGYFTSYFSSIFSFQTSCGWPR